MARCTILVVLLCAASVARAETTYSLEAQPTGERAVGIVGGSDVPPGKWPDTVAVLGASGSCTGTLIAPDVVLTAGHCAEIEPTTVIADTVDYSSSGGTRVPVAKTIAYDNWDATYDVSLVILAQPIKSVTPRKLATACTFSEFTSATSVRLVGFGSTSMDGSVPNTHLKEAMTQVLDATCEGGNGCNKSVSPGGEFVAGGAGTADSCFGDSGGPVLLDTPRGTFLIGTVSRGVDNSATACGGGGIYVRSDRIVRWIESTIGKSIETDSCEYAGSAADGSAADDVEAPTPDAGGCSATHSSGWLLALLVSGLVLASRRRR